jgi:hypothetical protein
MDLPRIIIVELAGGIHDGLTLIAEDPSPDIGARLGFWNDSDRAIAIFLDTKGGKIGARFSVGSYEMPNAGPKYGHYQKVSHRGQEYVLKVDVERFTEHEYAVTDRLADNREILIRAQHVDSSKVCTCLIYGNAHEAK